MLNAVVVGAPCKVNLSLDITGVREDGYHLLRSVMQTVDLCDYLILSRSDYEGIFIECDREQLICDTTNTAYRAAERFFGHTGMDHPAVHIQIIKNIPMQAGLGGGSSDAAATLVGLNAMYGTGLTLEELCGIGLKVGADVPFCLCGGTVLCEGVGEIFTELAPLPDCYLLIAKPSRGISTENSFRRYDKLTGTRFHPDINRIIGRIEAADLEGVAREMANVLEEVCELAEIDQLKRIMLENGALGAVMTGSGSAVFGIYDSKRAVRHAQRKLLTHASAVFIARPIRRGAALATNRP